MKERGHSGHVLELKDPNQANNNAGCGGHRKLKFEVYHDELRKKHITSKNGTCYSTCTVQNQLKLVWSTFVASDAYKVAKTKVMTLGSFVTLQYD